MNIVISFCMLCLLLVAGKILRLCIPLLQKLYIPSSVIGGILGLVLLQLFGSSLPFACTAGWPKLPGFLINIVFATLFLGTKIPCLKKVWDKSAPQLIYGQIVAWGQYTVGIGLSLLFTAFSFSIVPKFFGVIVPVGFEGGHGTAAGLHSTFQLLGWPEGADYGLASATMGIICAIILGMILINWAARNNLLSTSSKITTLHKKELTGIYPLSQRPVAGYQTVSADSIDTLALHIGIIGIAILLGYGIKTGLGSLETWIAPQSQNRFLQAFPLFPLCMIGGLLSQLILSKCKKTELIDHSLMQRISSTALDFLVVSAIATINLPGILKGLLPFALVILGAIAWNIFCVMWLAKRLLPDAWFERAIVEMGQSMGVTATGMLLLRVVDPDAKTQAYPAFGYKQLLHEPFMGGGLWTSIAIPLAIIHGPYLILFISFIAIVAWLVLAKIISPSE